VAVAGLSALARRLSLPYPIGLVLGGALLGFVPGLPEVRLDPEVVLLVFLPPLLYGSSIFANVNNFRGDLRWLALNTVGLVLVTMGAVAWVAHALIPGLPWAAAFVLGAIVSPTDPLAAATIMRRLDVPRRLVSAVEGEGLCNDATALVAYRVAVAAVVAGSFSLAEAGLRFVLGAAGGVAIGLVVGWVVAELRQRTTDAQVSVTISLLTAMQPSSRRTPSAPPGSWPRSRPVSIWGSERRGSCRSAHASRAPSSGTSSTSSSTRSCSC
jgi:NhaP-type Na+/H+ or K+/H+ antiporter